MTQPIIFSEAYYRQVIHEFSYDIFELHRFDFELAGMSRHELNLRYLCHHAADRFIGTPVDRRIITTGFGMSGPLHMATASHIMKMINIQRGDEHCQIVLGDLDAYNGRSRPFSYTHELAEKFHTFALRLAFDLNLLPICSRVGFLQDQVTAHDGRVTTPVWFDWSSGHPYLFGERFLAALEEAEDRLLDRGVQPIDPTFIDYRREEHRQILAAYAAVYGGSTGDASSAASGAGSTRGGAMRRSASRKTLGSTSPASTA